MCCGDIIFGSSAKKKTSKNWDTLINTVFSQIWNSFFKAAMHPKHAYGMTNSVGPDQNDPNIGLHCLLRPICPNT